MARTVNKTHSVLILSGSERTGGRILDALPKARFSPLTWLPSGGEARRTLLNVPFDLVIIHTPLPDEFGAELAASLSFKQGCGVLLLVREDIFDATADMVEGAGVLTLSTPNTAQAVYQALRLLTATQERLAAMEKQNRMLTARMEDVRIVNRAKWVLIERLRMDEAAAHRYLEKQAMDTRQSLRAVAQNILTMYEN